MIASIEQHVEWITDAIVALDAGGFRTIEPADEAQDRWVGYVNEIANHTLFHGCSSWYLGANVPESREFSCRCRDFPSTEPCASRSSPTTIAALFGTDTRRSIRSRQA